MTLALSDQESQLIRDQIQSNVSSLIYNTKSTLLSEQQFFLTQFNEAIVISKVNNSNNNNFQAENEEENDNIKNKSIFKHGQELRLQRNVLAKLVIDEKELTISLIEKRREFERRINKCKEKQIKLGFRQDESVKSINRYSQFISDKEIIRKKAIIKFQTELKSRLQKMIEYEVLSKQLEKVTAMHQRFSVKVFKHKKYKDFLAKAISLLPENYLEAGDSKFISLMLRHQTLYESNVDLFENLIANSDKLKALRNEYEKLVIEHNSNIMTVSLKLGEMQKIKDELTLKNVRSENAYWKDGDRKRQKVIDLSKIFWGIDNLAARSYEKHMKIPLEQMTVLEKLDIIQEHIMSKERILKLIHTNN